MRALRHFFSIAIAIAVAGFAASGALSAPRLEQGVRVPKKPDPSSAVPAVPGPSGSFSGCKRVATDMSPAGRVGNAQCKADEKWTQLRGKLGAFVPSGDAALLQLRRDGVGYFAQYERGRIYVADATGAAAAVYGGVAEAFAAFGGAAGALGFPAADAHPYQTAENKEGLYGKFPGGVIYWWPDTGAIVLTGPHAVYGAIARRYAELGGPTGKLGNPTSSEMPYGDDQGRYNTFERGTIYWWPDTGAFEGRSISVLFKGFRCFAESDNDGQSGSDEPVFVFTSYGVADGRTQSVRSKIFEGVDAGHTEATSKIVYTGSPDRLVLGISIWEHDTGDPDAYKDEIGGAAKAAGSAAGGAVAGPAGAAVAGAVAEAIGNAVSDALDTGDDLVDNKEMILSQRDILRLSRLPSKRLEGIVYNFESDLMQSEGEGSYILYFEVRPE